MAQCDRLEAARIERKAARDRFAAASLARLNPPDADALHDNVRFALSDKAPSQRQSSAISWLSDYGQGGPMRVVSRWLLSMAVALPLTANAIGQSAFAAKAGEPAVSAAQRMSQGGPEENALAADTGTWNVVSTLRLAPDAQPIISKGLIAERKMIGNYQQEVMASAPGSHVPDFRRIAYLYYFRVEGCWQYVSMDTRFPVGIMPAKTCEKEHDGRLTLEFEAIPFVGLGLEVEGRMVNSNLVIIHDTPDHEFIRQYWTRADGTGHRWLAVQYEYTRAK